MCNSIKRPDTPAPVAALRYAREIIKAHRSSEGQIAIGALAGDALIAVIQHAVRHHWNGACFTNMDCDCERCVMCGEPERVQRTPADRHDEEFPDTEQGPNECTGCGCDMDLSHLLVAA